ncbi:hypothetical protein [Streptomyces sp. 372A]
MHHPGCRSVPIPEDVADLLARLRERVDILADDATPGRRPGPCARRPRRVVDAHRLVETAYDKKNYTGHIKAYLKRQAGRCW